MPSGGKREERPAARSSGDGASMAANHRKHMRFEIDGSGTTVILKGFLSMFGIGRSNKAQSLMNLSEGGALVLATEQVPPGSRVRVRVDMEKYKDVFEADGMVRWCTRSRRRNGDFHLGIQFDSMPEAQARKLAKMRDWFTSSAYKARASTRARASGNIEFTS